MALGRALFKKPTVAIAETSVGVAAVHKNAEIITIPYAEFDALQQAAVGGPPMRSPAGLLWRLAQGTATRGVTGNWSVELLDAAAWEVGRSTLAATRAAVLDRLSLGLPCETKYLSITESELAWYKAHTAARGGDAAAMLSHLAALPSTGYAARCDLVVGQARAILDDVALSTCAIEVVAGLAGENDTARALIAALAPAPPRVFDDLVASFASSTAAAVDADPKLLADVGHAIATFARVPAISATSMPYIGAMDAYIAGRDGADLNDALEPLASLPLECVDELIDCGAVTRIGDDFRPWQSQFMNYVLARVSPGAVDEPTLRSAGFTSELARRAFMRADRGPLDSLDSRDEAVAHYRALFDLRDDPGGATVPPGLRREAVHIVHLAREVALAGAGGQTTVPSDVLDDPTIWPLLRKAAEAGHLAPSESEHAAAGPFTAWANLCILQRKLFDGQMQDVVVEGIALAQRTAYQPFAIEAQNMAAYACLQLGRTDDASKLIQRALDNAGFNTGLIINAAIASSESGTLASLPYLVKIFRSDEPSAIRVAAVRQAITMWLSDQSLPEYPAPLATLVREALLAGQGDEVHREFLMHSSFSDVDWLADATLPAATDDQAMANAYFQTRSRTLSDLHSDGYSDLCKVIVELSRQQNQPEWFTTERAKNVDLLMDGVHTEFGKAVGLALGIDVLVKGDSLEFFDRLILGPQAAAHLAAALDEDKAELNDAIEKRLVLDTVDLFRRRHNELTNLQSEAAQKELPRCVGMVTACFWFAAGREDSRIAGEFNALNERLRWDPQNAYTIQRMKAALLDDFDCYIVRGRRLAGALHSFDLNESQREIYQGIQSDLATWAEENKRLRSNLP